MRQHEEELQAKGVAVVVVTFEAGPLARNYQAQTNLTWPLLVDETRGVYAAYGMERGGWWSIYGPASWWVYAKLLFRGRRLQRPGDDVRQLGGDVLIDPEGIVRRHHVGDGPADRPSVADLLEVVG